MLFFEKLLTIGCCFDITIFYRTDSFLVSTVGFFYSVLYNLGSVSVEEAGNKAEFVMVPGQGHGFFQGQIYYDKVIEFFEKNIAGR